MAEDKVRQESLALIEAVCARHGKFLEQDVSLLCEALQEAMQLNKIPVVIWIADRAADLVEEAAQISHGQEVPGTPDMSDIQDVLSEPATTWEALVEQATKLLTFLTKVQKATNTTASFSELISKHFPISHGRKT